MSAQQLVGREEEQAEIARMIADVRNGISSVLVLHGEAGIGKTALLDATIVSAKDFTVVRVIGIESEMELGFAALPQILSRFAGGIDDLPSPQADALRAALGFGESAAPDRFLVGLAALTLLSSAAEARRLLIVIDDAQWVDRESAIALGFVARRVYADGIGMLVAVRDPSELQFAFEGLPSLIVDALSDHESRALLESSIDGPIGTHVRDRVLASASGNPLALLELSRELSMDQLAGTEVLPEPLGVAEQLEARFFRQVRALPPDTQELLLVLAAEPSRDPTRLRSAAELVGLADVAIVTAAAA